MDTYVRTGNDIWDSFCPTIARFLSNDKSRFTINSRPVSGYRSPDTTPIWLRDHTHQMKGFRHFEQDMTSALDIFTAYQMQDGAFYDFFDAAKDHEHREGEAERQHDDEGPHAYDRFRRDSENGIHFARCGVEADVEYLAVEAVHGAWQATGDDSWMANKLQSLERGLSYSMTSPIRWSQEYQLVKRPFTIDTWDFEYVGPKEEAKGRYAHGDNVHGNFWCIMHGDNSGMYHSCNLMAKMYRYLGNEDRASYWIQKARHFRDQANKVCWNGRFYTHQVHITPVNVPVDEAEQLSLSNTYDMNRGLPEHTQCVSIIREYMRRRDANRDRHFAEWYSIDPAFPPDVFGLDYLHPGIYVNGGIMPLVGGELAHAAFEHGFEPYGADILRRYYGLAINPGETYLWYKPNGEHVTYGTFLPTDGWGSAAMLYAFIEGLCGVKDLSKQYETVEFSPRWTAVGIESGEVSVGYGASDAGFRYSFETSENEMRLEVFGTGREARTHVLLPEFASASSVTIDGKTVDFLASRVESSAYLNFSIPLFGETRRIRIALM